MGINVRTSALRDAAREISSAGSSFRQKTEEGERIAYKVCRVWDSPAGSSFYNTYMRFSSDSSQACDEVFRGFSVFLTTASGDGYEETEKKLANTSSKFI